MIAFISGSILEKRPTRVLVDVNGIGYEINIPISTFETLNEKDEQIELHTYLYVREDILQLYGFSTIQEKEMFLLLIGVSGIGPKSAVGMLSSISFKNLQQGILQENVGLLSSVPGVGKKTAQRLILELKEKISKQAQIEAQPDADLAPIVGISNEAVLALTSLGYSKVLAEKTVLHVIKEPNNQSISLEECIKLSLRVLTRA